MIEKIAPTMPLTPKLKRKPLTETSSPVQAM
jgi:hypothetical protein